MTAVNETLEICEKRRSKNILVSYGLNLILSNFNREFKCPVTGQYNVSLDFTKSKDVFKYVPPFMKTLKGSSVVLLNLTLYTKNKGELVEFFQEIAFVKVSMK
jgi:hypothetical protein